MIIAFSYLLKAKFELGPILDIFFSKSCKYLDNLIPGDDADEAGFFNIKNCPKLAFECHQKIFNMYLKTIL